MEADIRPSFVPQLTRADGFYIAPAGRIASAWERQGDTVKLHVELPEAMTGQIYLEDGWEFQDGLTVKPAVSGEYAIVKK